MFPSLTSDRLTAAHAIRCAILFLSQFAGMHRERVIEGLAVNILRMRRQMPLQIGR